MGIIGCYLAQQWTVFHCQSDINSDYWFNQQLWYNHIERIRGREVGSRVRFTTMMKSTQCLRFPGKHFHAGSILRSTLGINTGGELKEARLARGRSWIVMVMQSQRRSHSEAGLDPSEWHCLNSRGPGYSTLRIHSSLEVGNCKGVLWTGCVPPKFVC